MGARKAQDGGHTGSGHTRGKEGQHRVEVGAWIGGGHPRLIVYKRNNRRHQQPEGQSAAAPVAPAAARPGKQQHQRCPTPRKNPDTPKMGVFTFLLPLDPRVRHTRPCTVHPCIGFPAGGVTAHNGRCPMPPLSCLSPAVVRHPTLAFQGGN